MAFRGVRATAVLLAAVLLSFPLVPAAAGASAFTDSFDRDDSSDVGNGWLEVSGALSISGMVLRSAPIRQLMQLAIVPTLSSARQTVAASFATGTTNNSPRFLLVLRYQNPQNYYLVSRRSGGTNAVQISKLVNGFHIESEHMFTHERRNEVLVIFSTEEEIATAGPKLQALVRANTVYD